MLEKSQLDTTNLTIQKGITERYLQPVFSITPGNWGLLSFQSVKFWVTISNIDEESRSFRGVLSANTLQHLGHKVGDEVGFGLENIFNIQVG